MGKIKQILPFVIVLVSVILSIIFAYKVDSCTILGSWKPRYGSNKQTCDGTEIKGYVWAKNKRMEQ